MNARAISMSGMLLLLAACTSTPAPVINYYRLGETPLQRSAELATNLPALVIDRVVLAQFLGQSGLVLAQGDHQLQVSRTHLWAEGLEYALPRALLAALERGSQEFRIYLDAMDYIPRRDYELRLQLESFHVTAAGEVVAAGRYQLVDTARMIELAARNFHFTENLEVDGYPHAVERMQVLVDRLAASISQDLSAYHERQPVP